jgi:uncharacterized delta-60 repeat protein
MNTKNEFKNLFGMPFTKLLAGLSLAAALPQSYAASGDVDLSFDAGSTVNGTVNAIASLPDGKVLIAGDFTVVHGMMRALLARLNPDGSTDPTFLNRFNQITNWNYDSASVSSIAVQPDAKILIAGVFSQADGLPHSSTARLNPDGTVDESFAVNNGSEWFPILLLQADGKVLVAGYTGIVRLNSDGSADNSFTSSFTDIRSIAIQTDGKIVAGTDHGLARLNPNGSPDPSFFGLPEPQGVVFTVALQPDGKILFAGENFPFGVFCMARAMSDGTLDASFPVKDIGWVNSLLLQSDGKILLAGIFGTIDGISQNIVARLNANGSLDTFFDDGLREAWGNDARCLALQPDGKILVGGNFATPAGTSPVRLNVNGTLDAGFGNGPAGCLGGTVRSMVIQPDGKTIVGGNFFSISGSRIRNLARLNASGILDSSFQPEGLGGWRSSGVACLSLQGDGKIVVGGDSLVRLNPNGSLDVGFGTVVIGPDTQISAQALLPNGQILIAGWFESVNSVPLKGLARLNADGSPEVGFSMQLEPPGSGNSGLNTVVPLPDGKMYIGDILPP